MTINWAFDVWDVFDTFGFFYSSDGFNICNVIECFNGFGGVDGFDIVNSFVDAFNDFDGSNAVNGINTISGIIFLMSSWRWNFLALALAGV